MQFAFFYPKNIFKLFWKISLVFAENLEMTQIAGGGGGGGSSSLRHYDAMRTKIDM